MLQKVCLHEIKFLHQILLHVYILLFKEHFKISSEMTLFIELHVYIYIVYAYFLYIPYRNYMYCRFTNHSGRCDWGGVLSGMTLPIQRSLLGSIKKVGSCLLHCSFVVLVIFFPLFLSLSHNHTLFSEFTITSVGYI